MPTTNRAIVTLRGSDDYGRFVDRLLAAVQVTNPEVADRNALGALALERLASRYGLEAPPRAKPSGRPRKNPQKGVDTLRGGR